MAKRRLKSMDVFSVDTASLLPQLCAAGSGVVVGTAVPVCSTPELNPTGKGYLLMAPIIASAAQEVVSPALPDIYLKGMLTQKDLA